MHLFPPIAQVARRLAAAPKGPPWARRRCKLQLRRLLPLLRNSNQFFNTIYITPTERTDPCGNPRQTCADIRSRNRGTQHSSPNLRGRILVASDDKDSFRPAHGSGAVGRGSWFFVKSSWVNVAEVSCSWGTPMPASTEAFSWTSNFPIRFSGKQHSFNDESG